MATIDSDVSGLIEKYIGIFGKGLVTTMAPSVVKETLISVLRRKGTNVKTATKWVEDDICLWDTLESRQQTALRTLRKRIVKIDWLTIEWVIAAIKQDMPAVASLFLGWRKGRNWLGRQIEIIKEKMLE